MRCHFLLEKEGIGYAYGKHDYTLCLGDEVVEPPGPIHHSHDILCDCFLDQLVRKI